MTFPHALSTVEICFFNIHRVRVTIRRPIAISSTLFEYCSRFCRTHASVKLVAICLAEDFWHSLISSLQLPLLTDEHGDYSEQAPSTQVLKRSKRVVPQDRGWTSGEDLVSRTAACL